MKHLPKIITLILAMLFLAACGMFAPIPDPVDPWNNEGREHDPGQETVSITIPEGFNFLQIAQRLEANGVVSAEDFFQAAQSFEVQSFDTPFDPQAAFNLEGFLFPDTYEFLLNDDPNRVLRIILNNYYARVVPMMHENNTGLTDYEILILASIIEREVRSDEHMAMVSSVLHNRLEIDMMLQVCPTRYYVLDTIMQSPWYSNDDSVHWLDLYNTYRFTGIPIGPIANPGTRAIHAALNPVETDYLFFFFGMDNNNHYSRTYDEHRDAMARIGVNFG